MQQMKNARRTESLQAGCKRAEASAAVNNGQHDSNTNFYNGKGKLVGKLEDGWLVKRVNTRYHQLRQPPAWACDAEHLERLNALGANGVRLVDDKEQIWEASLKMFDKCGIPFERGCGMQVALPLSYWSIRHTQQELLPFLEVG